MAARTCTNCGSAMGAEEQFCRNCGTSATDPASPWGPARQQGYASPAYPGQQPMYPPGYPSGWAQPGYPAQPAVAYEGFWIRVGATLIDGFLLGIIGWILTNPFNGWISIETNPDGTFADWNIDQGKLQVWLAMNALSLLLGITYHVYCWSRWGQTLGKRAVGIKVVDERGELLSMGRCIGRYFSYWVSAITLYIGFLMVAWDSRKQGLHDKIVGSYVVKARQEQAYPPYPQVG